MVPSLWFTSLQTQFCQFTVSMTEFGLVLVTASSGILFANRVVAIWGGSKAIALLVGGLYLYTVACWVRSSLYNLTLRLIYSPLQLIVGLQYRATTGPPAPLFSNCVLGDLVPWAPISYASSVVYDVAIFLLTLARLKSPNLKNSPISRQIYLDSLFYVAVTAAVNITVVTFQALPDRFELLKPTVVPFSTVVTVGFVHADHHSWILTLLPEHHVAEGLSKSEAIQRAPRVYSRQGITYNIHSDAQSSIDTNTLVRLDRGHGCGARHCCPITEGPVRDAQLTWTNLNWRFRLRCPHPKCCLFEARFTTLHDDLLRIIHGRHSCDNIS
jgi:hypothetical protein